MSVGSARAADGGPKGGHIRRSREDRLYYWLVNLFVTLIFLIVLYPLIFVISSSLSDPNRIAGHGVLLWPIGFSLEGYRAVFAYSDVLIGYRNTLFYTVAGTVLNVLMTLICAYPLARKKLPFRNQLMAFFTFVMFLDGGLIPSYILVRKLGIINSFWAILLPGAISVYNMIITRTFLQSSLPDEMLEAAQVDGCSDFRFFFSFVIPLSKAIIAVITLYYAVRHWNEWFNAFIYLDDRQMYPLQLFLREILITNSYNANMAMDSATMERMEARAELMKYALIVIASAPVMCLYPFAQRYFIRGVMIGSIKG